AADRQLHSCQFFLDAPSGNCQVDLLNRNFGNQDSERPRNAMISVVATPSTRLTNEARFGWLQDRQLRDSISPQKFADLDIPIKVSAFNDLIDYLRRSSVKNDIFQWTDTLTLEKGSHAIQTGFNIRRLRVEQAGVSRMSDNLPIAEVGQSL